MDVDTYGEDNQEDVIMADVPNFPIYTPRAPNNDGSEPMQIGIAMLAVASTIACCTKQSKPYENVSTAGDKKQCKGSEDKIPAATKESGSRSSDSYVVVDDLSEAEANEGNDEDTEQADRGRTRWARNKLKPNAAVERPTAQ